MFSIFYSGFNRLILLDHLSLTVCKASNGNPHQGFNTDWR